VHDTADLETRGIPSVFVATVEFQDGAARQAEALGADLASVLVSHPIQDRTDQEIRDIADLATEPIVSALEKS